MIKLLWYGGSVDPHARAGFVSSASFGFRNPGVCGRDRPRGQPEASWFKGNFPGITYYPGQLACEPCEAGALNGASAHECFGVVIFDDGSQVTPEREQKIAPCR